MGSNDYFESLGPDIKTRYLQKLSIINNIDPYELKDEECSFDVISDVPEIHYLDIVSYFIYTHSFYSTQQLKAYKSLEAFKYYEAGFVQKIICKKVLDNCIVVGEVKHSQRMSEKNLKVWLIVLSSGSISSAHCTCMAGLGEVCSHIAAIAFALLHRQTSDDEVSCTGTLAVWPVPKAPKNVVPKKISEIHWGRNIEYFDKKLENVPCLKDTALKGFLKELDDICKSAVILQVVEPHASNRKVPDVDYNVPMVLTALYDSTFETADIEELRNVDIDFSITEEEKNNVRHITMEQSTSSAWYKFRAGRITASLFKQVCHTSLDNPSLSLIKRICYPEKVLFKTKATAYGLQHEEVARKEYEKAAMKNHESVSIQSTGFVISVQNPIMGASPDGLVFCNCCGPGCIEIKCPYRLKDCDLQSFVNMDNCCLFGDGNGNFKLKLDHEYFYQVQLQMYVTKTTYCDFIVWSRRYLNVERIYFDENFLKSNLGKSERFHKHVIIPELLARWYTSSNSSMQPELWCICRQPDDGREMLRCANEDCSTGWFHIECLNIVDVPTLFWFCKECSVNLNQILQSNR